MYVLACITLYLKNITCVLCAYEYVCVCMCMWQPQLTSKFGCNKYIQIHTICTRYIQDKTSIHMIHTKSKPPCSIRYVLVCICMYQRIIHTRYRQDTDTRCFACILMYMHVCVCMCMYINLFLINHVFCMYMHVYDCICRYVSARVTCYIWW